MKVANVSLLTLLIASASALHIPFERRGTGATPIRLRRRDGNPPNASDPYHFDNLSGYLYVGNITVDGLPFEVQLDSGSSDLWVQSTGITFPSATKTNIQGEIQYFDTTEAAGPILLAPVTFGNWTAPEQAFICAIGSNATTLGDRGLLGLGPPSLSTVATTLIGTQYNGNSFLSNVFEAYPSDPNIITFLLSRSVVSGTTDGGDFTISTLVPGYEDILSTTPLTVTKSDRWETVADGFIVNGTAYSGGSLFLQGSQISVNLDTGTTYAYATRTYVDALYSKIVGAEWSDDAASYLFPCDSVVNVSVVFGNRTIFIHPIDLSAPWDILNNSVICAGNFQVPDTTEVDIILGDSFLMNVYSLYFFGNWTTPSASSPYMQILNVTDPNQAFSEFSSLNALRIQDFITYYNANSDSHTIARYSSVIMGMVGLSAILLLS